MEKCYCCKKELPERLKNYRMIEYVGAHETKLIPVCNKCDHTKEGKRLKAMQEESKKEYEDK